MAKLVSSASMIRILKQVLHSNIEVYGLFVYIKIELCGSHRIAVFLKSECYKYRPGQENAYWLKKVLLMKNCQFFSNFYETWSK